MSVIKRKSEMKLTNPMLRKRFLVEGFGSVKKFHNLTKDSSERESRDKREDAEEEDLLEGLDKGTVCPEIKIVELVTHFIIDTWR
jgi:hypothetical protein